MEKVKYGNEIRLLLFKIGFSHKIEDTDSFSKIGMDSIVFVHLLIEVELMFNIEIPDDLLLMERIGSIAKLSSVIEGLLDLKCS